MRITSDLLKEVKGCFNPKWITNRHSGKQVKVNCGICDFCIHQKACKNSIRVKTAGSQYKYCYFVTLTYDDEHLPLFSVSIDTLASEYLRVDDIDGNWIATNVVDCSEFIPLSRWPLSFEDNCKICFSQVQGTIPFNSNLGCKCPVTSVWFGSSASVASFIAKSQKRKKGEFHGYSNLPDGVSSSDCLPFLNYVDVQNYIKRLRKHLFTFLGTYDEKISFYAVGEYGPVSFRPHWHLLLFTNSDKVAEVLRQAHDKSWKLGRSDFQLSRGGSASYVASYVNSLASAPSLYRICPNFKPQQHASFGFYEKCGESFGFGSENKTREEQACEKIAFLFDGRVHSFGEKFVRCTPPLSYVRAFLPRFSSVGPDDFIEASRIALSVLRVDGRLAEAGLIDVNDELITNIVRNYISYLHYTGYDDYDTPKNDDDYLILRECRLLMYNSYRTQWCLPISDDDFLEKRLYPFFRKVFNFLDAWCIENVESDIRFMRFIFHYGYEYENKTNYANLVRSLSVQQDNPDVPYCYFVHWESFSDGRDFDQRLEELDRTLKNKYAAMNRDAVKHKRLNDANGFLNSL